MKTLPLLRGALLSVVLATAACGGQGGAVGGQSTAGGQSGSRSTTAGATSGAAAPGAAAPGAAAPGASASGKSASGGSASSGSASESRSRTTKSSARATAPNTVQLRKNVTDRQRKYIAQNAPPGVDAEAILQSGEDACRRMQIAQAAAGQTSVSVALLTGQISNGRDAITYLCPSLKPALAAADKGFADGTFVVGSQAKKGSRVAAGRYSAPQTSDGCVWSVTDADGSVAANGRGNRGAAVTLKRGQSITSSGCFAWLPAS